MLISASKPAIRRYREKLEFLRKILLFGDIYKEKLEFLRKLL